MKHLRLNMYEMAVVKDKRHPEKVMRDLGISYKLAVPQSLFDEWWFFGCENIPKSLPDYVEDFNVNPMDCVGHGLTKEMAESLIK